MTYLPWSPRTWRATANTGLDLVYGPSSARSCISGLALGLGLLVLVVGVFVVAATLIVARCLRSALPREAVAGSCSSTCRGRPQRRRRGGRLLAANRSTSCGRRGVEGAAARAADDGARSALVRAGDDRVGAGAVPGRLPALRRPRCPDGPAVQWHLLGVDLDARGIAGRIVAGVLGRAAALRRRLARRARRPAPTSALARALLGPNEAEALRAQVAHAAHDPRGGRRRGRRRAPPDRARPARRRAAAAGVAGHEPRPRAAQAGRRPGGRPRAASSRRTRRRSAPSPSCAT